MSEQLTERIDRLEFNAVKPGDVIHITTGVADDEWKYVFEVSNTSTIWPDGTLKATAPDGTEGGATPFALHGCGSWTNRRQNPVQNQERAFTPYYEGLVVGRFLLGMSPDSTERLVFDKPGQEISEITVTKS
jgi:hypothetical protein